MNKHCMNAKSLTSITAAGLFTLLAVQPATALANEQLSNGVNISGSPAWIIDDIVCEGNNTTDCDFITKKYYQHVGDVLDPNEIADARLRLGTLFQFKNVSTRLKKGAERGHVVVVFAVSEASNIQYDLGLGYRYGQFESKFNDCNNPDSLLELNTNCLVNNTTATSVPINIAVTDFN
ncbi:MAG: hypothetical protein ACI8WB_001969, partial [Phenylobacterium sp.]